MSRNSRNVFVPLLGSLLIGLFLVGCGSTTTTTNTSPAATATPRPPAATPTSSLPAGFKKYTGDPNFTIAYPSDWMQSAASAGTGVAFTGSAGQSFQAIYVAGASDPASIVGATCQGGGGTIGQTTTVSIGGQQWIQGGCQIANGAAQLVAEAVTYKGNTYLIAYGAPTLTFATDKTMYFTPMEKSFQFLK